MVRARKAFCQMYKDKSEEFWKKVIDSDESYICINLNSAMNRVRRFSYSNPYSPKLGKQTIKHPPKVMVWGCFNYNGVGSIKVFDGTMNKFKY